MNNDGLDKIKSDIDDLIVSLKSGSMVDKDDTINKLQSISVQVHDFKHEREMKLNRIVRMLHE